MSQNTSDIKHPSSSSAGNLYSMSIQGQIPGDVNPNAGGVEGGVAYGEENGGGVEEGGMDEDLHRNHDHDQDQDPDGDLASDQQLAIAPQIGSSSQQLALSFQGEVYVFDSVSPEKVQAVLLLLGGREISTPVPSVPVASQQYNKGSNFPHRVASLMRFREKRKERNFDKKIRYTVRKEVTLRYSATTILTLLKEIALSSDVKIDWRELVKGSSTGITNPREYQLLWRHLAYREPLLEKIDEAEPMDDDSDLEFELETIPAVNSEVSPEIAACVKILMPSKLQSPTNDWAVEAKSRVKTSDGLKANTASDKKSVACPDSRKKITIPLHKQMDTRSTTECSEGIDAADSGPANKKKRKLWTEEEDSKLTAAVQKHGEGNWTAILKEIKPERNSQQLYQRWSTLKKRQAKVEPHGATTKSNCSREVLDAARIAVDSALQMPISRSSSVIQTGTQSPATSNTSTIPSRVPKTTNFMQQTLTYAASPSGNHASLIQSQTTLKASRASMKPPVPTQNTIKAAALFAGGRVAGPDSARSLMMAAQSNNARHFKADGSQLISSAQRICQRNSRLMMHSPVSRSTKASTATVRENAEKMTGKEISESTEVAKGGEQMEDKLGSESRSTMNVVGEKDKEEDDSKGTN